MYHWIPDLCFYIEENSAESIVFYSECTHKLTFKFRSKQVRDILFGVILGSDRKLANMIPSNKDKVLV